MGTANKCLISYLRDRTQCVKRNNAYSNPLDINTGVPQGTVFGPILLNICISNLMDCTGK